MIKFYNAGTCGAEYSEVDIKRVSDAKGLLQFRTSGHHDVVLNPEQILKLHEALGAFIKEKNLSSCVPKLIEGTSF